ncbi:MAG: GNAT family N-acetyltransferase [Proteobacteria bacterium]|nr:GNAT family N-acetyltransferase [Pseudomonadota bacterium]
MSIPIRKAVENDTVSAANIVREAFKDVAKRFKLSVKNAPTHPSNCTEEWIEDALSQGIGYYLLDNDGIPVGCVALEKASSEVCYLERLGVLPDYRKRGFGEALVEHVLVEAKKLGTVRVEIGIIAEHVELKQWYKKLGFVERNTTRYDHLPFAVTFLYIEL